MAPNTRIKQHIKENRLQYMLILLLFISGVILGDFKVLGLEGGVRSHLVDLIDNYLKGGGEVGLDGQSLLYTSFLNQAKSVIGIWFLGLTVIGIPLILGWVFLRGFALGFTIGFLIQEKAAAGIILSLISILPQNIVYIPLLIVWSVVAINFSLFVVKGRQAGRIMSLGRTLLGYSVLMCFFMLFALLGALIEAYLSPWLLSLFL